MKLFTYLPDNIDDIFTEFEFAIDLGTTPFGKCIAYENFGGDEYRLAFDTYIDGTYRYFAVCAGDLPLVVADALEDMRSWARTDDVTVLKAMDTRILFELGSPFGIRFIK